jgi:hypothetical protein
MKVRSKYDILKEAYKANINIYDTEDIDFELGYLQGLYEGKMITLEQKNKLNKILREGN